VSWTFRARLHEHAHRTGEVMEALRTDGVAHKVIVRLYLAVQLGVAKVELSY
jgi:hypothetical protein